MPYQTPSAKSATAPKDEAGGSGKFDDAGEACQAEPPDEGWRTKVPDTTVPAITFPHATSISQARPPAYPLTRTTPASMLPRHQGVFSNNMFAIGQAELVSQGCDRMTLRYRFDDSTDAGEFRARSGEIALQRIGACARD